MTIAAIDPGANGGIAWKYEGTVMAIPLHLPSLPQLLRDIAPDVLIVEKVGGYIGRPMPGSRMFNFGFNTGMIHGIAAGIGLQIETVRPQEWQAALGIGKMKDHGGKAGWKKKLACVAREKFPHLKVTEKTADALLILDWRIKQ